MALFFQFTFAVTLTGLSLLLFKKLFQYRISAGCHYALWLVLALRMALVLLPVPQWDLGGYTPKVTRELSDLEEYVASSKEEHPPLSLPEISPEAPSPSQQTVRQTFQVGIYSKSFSLPVFFTKWISVIWIGGGTLLLGYFITGYGYFCSQIKKRSQPCPDETKGLLQEAVKQMEIRQRVGCRCYGEIPMLKGFFFPCILLPKNLLNSSSLHFILIHELCHLRYHHLGIGLLAMLLLCLNWYNPVFWFCYRAFRRDMELFCDSQAIKRLGQKRAYAGLLLDTAVEKDRFLPLTTCMAVGKKEIVYRIEFLSRFRKPGLWIALAGVLVTGLILTGCIASGGRDLSVSSSSRQSSSNAPEEKMGQMWEQLQESQSQPTFTAYCYLPGKESFCTLEHPIPEEGLSLEEKLRIQLADQFGRRFPSPDIYQLAKSPNKITINFLSNISGASPVYLSPYGDGKALNGWVLDSMTQLIRDSEGQDTQVEFLLDGGPAPTNNHGTLEPGTPYPLEHLPIENGISEQLETQRLKLPVYGLNLFRFDGKSFPEYYIHDEEVLQELTRQGENPYSILFAFLSEAGYLGTEFQEPSQVDSSLLLEQALLQAQSLLSFSEQEQETVDRIGSCIVNFHSQLITKEQVEEIFSSLYGETPFQHQSVANFRYIPYAGVYLPPGIGGVRVFFPQILSCEELTDRYRVLCRYYGWGLGEYYTAGEESIRFSREELLEYVQNGQGSGRLCMVEVLKTEENGFKLQSLSYADGNQVAGSRSVVEGFDFSQSQNQYLFSSLDNPDHVFLLTEGDSFLGGKWKAKQLSYVGVPDIQTYGINLRTELIGPVELTGTIYVYYDQMVRFGYRRIRTGPSSRKVSSQ